MKPARSPHVTGVLAETSAHVDRRRDDVVGRRDRGDDLDQLHDRRGIEEVHAHDVLRALGRRSEVDDGQARRRGRQDRAGLADLVEGLEQHRLHRQVLDDGLHHQVDGRPCRRGASCRSPAPGRRRGRPRSSLPRATPLPSERSRPRAPSRPCRRCARRRGPRSPPWRTPRRCRPPWSPSRRRRPCCTGRGSRPIARRPGVSASATTIGRVRRLVRVEAAAGLAAAQAGRDHLLEDRRGCVQPVADLLYIVSRISYAVSRPIRSSRASGPIGRPQPSSSRRRCPRARRTSSRTSRPRG